MVVQTVLGEVTAQELGMTLTHEHFALDFNHFYTLPPSQLAEKLQGIITLNTSGFVRQYPYSSKYNLTFGDSDTNEAVLKDVLEYKKYGGATIVENTTTGLNRDLNFLREVSSRTGVHVVAGTGYYIADMQEHKNQALTKENMYNFMLEELVTGCKDHNSIKAGFMGEIASVWPIKDFERRAIAAVGEVQEQMGCGASFHPHRDHRAPATILRYYLEAGGRASKAVMSHLDRTLLDDESFLDFAALGSYCQLDLFGVECSYYQLNTPTDMVSDAQRIAKIQTMIADGRSNQVLMSQDIHTKHRLTQFGGHGFAHIINNILPRMAAKGIPQETINQITIKNPADWLKFGH